MAARPARFRVAAVPVQRTRALRRAILRPGAGGAEIESHEGPGSFAVAAFADARAPADDPLSRSAGDEQIVAVGLVMPEGEPGAWRVRGMATSPSERGRGAGTAVLDALVAHATAQGAGRVWCNARLPARSLYRRRGFVVVSDVFELPGIGPHVVMELALATRRGPARAGAGARRGR